VTVPVQLHDNDVIGIPGNQSGTGTVLFGNFPNPFGSSTTIRYSLGVTEQVRMEIFDLHGRQITTLVDTRQQPGEYRVHWDGKDGGGRLLPGGVYECRLTAGGFSSCLKLIIIR
jgi:hypothetical protein